MVTQHTFYVKILDRRQLCRDMIVFEMFGHLGELVFAAEAEHGAGLVDVDDALSVHAERGTAVLEHHSATRPGGLAESRRF